MTKHRNRSIYTALAGAILVAIGGLVGCLPAETDVDIGEGSSGPTGGSPDVRGQAGPASVEPATRCFQIDGREVCVQSDDPGVAPGSTDPGLVPPPPGGVPASAELPRARSLRIGDQGSCGSCVPWATRYGMGLLSPTWADFSIGHIWKVAGYTGAACGRGSQIDRVVSSQESKREFVVDATTWPYSAKDPRSSLDALPNASVLASSGKAYIGASLPVASNGLSDIEASIAQGWPVLLAVPVYTGSGWETTGDIGVPPASATLRGYHAITLYSYNASQRRVGFVNSWGEWGRAGPWGTRGAGSLSYDFIEKYSRGGRALTHLSLKGAAPACGNGKCEAGETSATCCLDCACSAGMTCLGGACTPPCGGNGQTCCAGGACSPGLRCQSGACRTPPTPGCSCRDVDGDSYYPSSCTDPLCPARTDCNDNSASVRPGAAEVCNGVDDNCNGAIDEGDACVWSLSLPNIALGSARGVGHGLSLTRGDREFSSRGPNVVVTVRFTTTADRVYATGCVTMTETTSDWTSGNDCFQYYWPVKSPVVLTNDFEVRYTDTDHGFDDAIARRTYLVSSPAVTGVTCVGDTPGHDICNDRTWSSADCSGCMVYGGTFRVRHAP